MRNDFSIYPLTFLMKIGPSLCNIGAIQRFRSWLRKIRPIAVNKHLNIYGGLSFTRHRDEEARSRVDGSIPSRVDIFICTHSRKDGTPVDERSAEIISKFKELSATQEGGSSSSVGDKIYTQVMGEERHGRVRGYGLGPTPTSVFGSTLRQNNAAFDEVVGELSSVKGKLQQMEEWKNNQEEEMRLMHVIIAEMRQWLSAQGHDPSEGGADG